MIARYILSKLDFQSFSIIDPVKSFSNEEKTRLQTELTSYLNLLKELPTIMRKIAPNPKSESYRLLKSENFQSIEIEYHLTDLLLASLITD
jgi:hypothetical protein